VTGSGPTVKREKRSRTEPKRAEMTRNPFKTLNVLETRDSSSRDGKAAQDLEDQKRSKGAESAQTPL